MATTQQQERRKVRDRKKSWELTVSSIKAAVGPSDVLSATFIRSLVRTAHELGLSSLALVGLEALKVAEMHEQLDRALRSNTALEKLVVKARADLAKAQEQISKMNVRYVRRASKKAYAQHPEKRGAR